MGRRGSENDHRQSTSQIECHFPTPRHRQLIKNYDWDKIITLGTLKDPAALLQIQASIFLSKQWDESLT